MQSIYRKQRRHISPRLNKPIGNSKRSRGIKSNIQLITVEQTIDVPARYSKPDKVTGASQLVSAAHSFVRKYTKTIIHPSSQDW